jgi:hypothetical protein
MELLLSAVVVMVSLCLSLVCIEFTVLVSVHVVFWEFKLF